MTVDLTLFVIGAGMMAVAVFVGRGVRGIVHAILPTHDPVFALTLAAEAAAVLAPSMGLPLPDLVWPAIVAWDTGYILGYTTARTGDVVYLDVPDGGLTVSDIGPLVIYHRDGHQYWMPQTLSGVVRSMLGARCPLDAPLGSARNVRRVTAANGIYPALTMTVVPVSFYAEEEAEATIVAWGRRWIRDADGHRVETGEPRHRISCSVTIKTLRFAQEVIDDPEVFWTKSAVYLGAVAKAREASERATRLEVQMQSAVFDAGAEIVAGLISLQKDAPGTRDEVLEAVRAERARREAPVMEAGHDAEDQRRWHSRGGTLRLVAHEDDDGGGRLPSAGGRPLRHHGGRARGRQRDRGRTDPLGGAGARLLRHPSPRGAPGDGRGDRREAPVLCPLHTRARAGAAVGAWDRGPRSPDRPGRALGPDGRLRGPRSL